MARVFAAVLTVLAAPVAVLADQVPAGLAQRFAELARRGEAAMGQAGPAAAIRVYEEGLATFPEGYGRIHLRLGQLYQQLGRSVEAALHYRTCDADTKVEPIDRELICQDGFKAVTGAVELTNLPQGGRVLVVEPAAFAGPLKSGDRLPLGGARVLVEAPSHDRREVSLRIAAPGITWAVELGQPYADEENAAEEQGGRRRAAAPAGPTRWPAYLTGGVGLALVAGGLAVGFLNRGTLEDIRDKQAASRCGAGNCRADLDTAETTGTVADVLWIGGAGVTAAGVGWWLLGD